VTLNQNLSQKVSSYHFDFLFNNSDLPKHDFFGTLLEYVFYFSFFMFKNVTFW